MNIKGVELFSSKECNDYIEKFTDKINECNSKIEQLKGDIVKCEADCDVAIEADILQNSSSSKKDLSNITARQGNLKGQLEIELKRLSKIREIMMAGLAKLVPVASKQMDNDLVTFDNTVEDEVYRQLRVLKEQQAELLLTLQVAHNAVTIEMFHFNELCHFADLNQYKKTTSNDLFQTGLFVTNRRHPEHGTPLLNCPSLPYIEEHLQRSRADANAEFNSYRSEADKEQLPLAKGYKDIDLQQFLDSL